MELFSNSEDLIYLVLIKAFNVDKTLNPKSELDKAIKPWRKS